MNRRVIAVLVALPLLLTTLTVARTMANLGGNRESIVLSEREITIGRRGSDSSGVRLWVNWSDPRKAGIERSRSRGLRRRTYVALHLDPAIPEGSRLVAVDHHDDPDVLAQRYPSGRTHIITAATVTDDGRVQRIDPSGLVVPRELASRAPIASGTRADFRVEERYLVTLRYGRHWQPVLVDIQRR
jgi:hypothetical protein